MRAFSALVIALLIAGCNDYDLQKTGDKVSEGDTDTDGFTPATETGGDSADTDTGTLVVPDSGETDTGEPDPEVATESIYLNTGSALYGYDPTTNTATKVGSFKLGGRSVSDMTDIAIDLNGYMYGVAYAELYRVTPTTAELTHVATLDASYNALTFVSDGTLVAAGDSQVVAVDTTTGRTKRIGGNGYTSSGDIVGLPDGFLYWSTSGGGSDDLVQIDPTTGAAVRLGSIGQSSVYALGYAYGALYGFTDGSKVMVIDSTTGKATSNDRLSGSWWGATTNPVKW